MAMFSLSWQSQESPSRLAGPRTGSVADVVLFVSPLRPVGGLAERSDSPAADMSVDRKVGPGGEPGSKVVVVGMESFGRLRLEPPLRDAEGLEGEALPLMMATSSEAAFVTAAGSAGTPRLL